MKVLIVGAGIAGLAIGWRLAQSGVEVEILERGVAGRGATWASAGMIAPGAERLRETSEMSAFARLARANWPSFAAELEEQSGQSICYRQSGSLLVAEGVERVRSLEAQTRELARGGVAATWLAPEELRRCEPLLSHAVLGALRIAEDAQVDNRALADALCAAIRKSGGRWRENCDVRAVAVQQNCARGAVTPQGVIEADRIVLACGAWMNLIGGLGPEDLPPVSPVKGQMVACQAPEGVALPGALIWAEDVYLVPRHDRLFIGATVEDASFDTSISREARDSLIQAAVRLIPAAAEWRVAEMWAGLRPRTPDDAPVLGATVIEGLYVAGGQFRNGILFAPAVADTMCRLILDRARGSDGSAFDPQRFAVS